MIDIIKDSLLSRVSTAKDSIICGNEIEVYVKGSEVRN